MSDPNQTPEATPEAPSRAEQSTAAQKYKTLARALAANDVPACREILDIYKEQGRELSDEETYALGMRWFMGKSHPIETAQFLHEIGFSFKQNIILDRENENVGKPLALRLIGNDETEELLYKLIEAGVVEKDIMDGLGDSILVEALMMGRFDCAAGLVQRGVDINASNIGGDTAMHTFAGRLNYQAIEWLCRNGANPEIENLQGARASEMVPEVMEGWNTDCVFEVLEDYVQRFQKGQAFEANPEFMEMVAKEKGPEPGEDDDQTLGQQADAAKIILTKIGV